MQSALAKALAKEETAIPMKLDVAGGVLSADGSYRIPVALTSTRTAMTRMVWAMDYKALSLVLNRCCASGTHFCHYNLGSRRPPRRPSRRSLRRPRLAPLAPHTPAASSRLRQQPSRQQLQQHGALFLPVLRGGPAEHAALWAFAAATQPRGPVGPQRRDGRRAAARAPCSDGSSPSPSATQPQQRRH